MEINSSSSYVNIQIPNIIKYDNFVNYTDGYVYYENKYNPTYDVTTFRNIYNTTQPNYIFRINFDWEIENKESYYQRIVRIPFSKTTLI